MIETTTEYVEGLLQYTKDLEDTCNEVIKGREEFDMRYFRLLTAASKIVGYTRALTDKLSTRPDTNGKTATEMLFEHAFVPRYTDSINPGDAIKEHSHE